MKRKLVGAFRARLRLLSWLVLLPGASGSLSADQAIYTDNMQNGWGDWSWCVRDINNPSPVFDGTRSIRADCSGWTAVSLGHVAFDTSTFTNIVFYAHGGISGGQHLEISARRSSGNPTNFVSIGPLAAGTWQRVSVPLNRLGVENVPDCTVFWIRNASADQLPTFYLDQIFLETRTNPAIPPPGTTISLEAESGNLIGTTISTLTPGFSGSGYVTQFDSAGDSVSWTFGASSGLYRFWVRFRSPYGQKGFEADLNSNVLSATFPQRNTFETFDAGLVELSQGANSLRIGGGWNYYEIDRVDFVPADPPPAPLPVPAGLCDPLATPAAKALMQDLAADYGHHTWSGQQEASEASTIFGISGRYPAIVCGDFMDYSPSRIAFGSNPGNYTENMIKLEGAHGHVLSMCWHWNAPSGLLNTVEQPWWRGFYTEASTFDLAAALADTNSVEFAQILRDIDAIAVQLKKFSDNGLPVLWRPLHESEGGWFWWGARGPEPFKQLWRLLYARLTMYHHLHNLVWVLTSADPLWYPGDDVVDIVGLDAYPSDRSDVLSSSWEALKSRFDGAKLLALSEFGGVPDIQRMQKFGVWWCYFSSWTGTYGPTSMPSETVSRIYQSSEVITVDELTAAPPRFTGVIKTNMTDVSFLGRGPRGAAYKILVSPQVDLPIDAWSQAGTGIFAGGVFSFSGTGITNAASRFYQILRP